jgi:hypothetical protein
MRTIILAGSLAALAAGAVRAQPAVGWPETVDRLNEQRSQAQACLELLKDSGDAAAIHKGRIVYGAAKSAADGVIAGFTVGLVEGYKPEKLPPLQANLERAGKGLKEVCDDAVHAAPKSGSKGIVEDLAKGRCRTGGRRAQGRRRRAVGTARQDGGARDGDDQEPARRRQMAGFGA